MDKHVCSTDCDPENMEHVGKPGEVAADLPPSAYPVGSVELPQG